MTGTASILFEAAERSILLLISASLCGGTTCFCSRCYSGRDQSRRWCLTQACCLPSTPYPPPPPRDESNLALSGLHLARPQRGGEGKRMPTPQKVRASSTPSLNFHQGPSSPVRPLSFVQSLALKHHILLRSKDMKTGGRRLDSAYKSAFD